MGMRTAGMAAALLPFSLLLSSGCGQGDDAPELVMEGAWARAMPAAAGGAGARSAAYVLIRNQGEGADTLVGGETVVAGALELHESREVDGVMQMRPVEGIEIAGEGSAELRPGGLHIMLLDLAGPLEEGDTVTLSLRFRRSSVVPVRFPVLRSGPS